MTTYEVHLDNGGVREVDADDVSYSEEEDFVIFRRRGEHVYRARSFLVNEVIIQDEDSPVETVKEPEYI